MEYVYPSYYFRFQCVGGRCPDTCCAGWEIGIDDGSLIRYEKYQGGFGNRLRNSIDFHRKSFLQFEHRCVLLNEKGLCDIQAEAGEGMLCRACARYPRHMEAYGNVREFSLNLSCPEAARIILSQEKLVLKRVERPERDGDNEALDQALFSELLAARRVLLHIIQDDQADIRSRMMMLLGLTHHLQRQLRSGQLAAMDKIYRHYLRPGAGESYRGHMTEKLAGIGVDRYHTMKAILHKLHCLEVVSPDWPERLRYCERALYGKGKAVYDKMTAWHLSPKIQEQLLSYFIYVYFVGAVYDGRPYLKVKLAVASVMIIEEMLRAQALEEGCVGIEECVDTAHRFAREIEHSDANLNRLESMLAKEQCLNIHVLSKLNL